MTLFSGIFFVSLAGGAEGEKPTPPERENFKIFLLAGQSNMAGRGVDIKLGGDPAGLTRRDDLCLGHVGIGRVRAFPTGPVGPLPGRVVHVMADQDLEECPDVVGFEQDGVELDAFGFIPGGGDGRSDLFCRKLGCIKRIVDSTHRATDRELNVRRSETQLFAGRG